MGNLSFLIPTIKIENFTLEVCLDLIEENYPEVNAKMIEGFRQIRVEYKGKLVFEAWNQECYLLDDDESNNNEDLKYVLALKKAGLDKTKSICINYGNYAVYKKRNSLIKFLGKIFKAYLLDEGIHPEYIVY